MELWIGDTTGKTRRIEGVAVNGVMPGGVQWMPGDKTLLVETVRANRGAAPREPVPTGPARAGKSRRRRSRPNP
jgi:hypothetical protein